jgi:hypothetical protein
MLNNASPALEMGGEAPPAVLERMVSPARGAVIPLAVASSGAVNVPVAWISEAKLLVVPVTEVPPTKRSIFGEVAGGEAVEKDPVQTRLPSLEKKRRKKREEKKEEKKKLVNKSVRVTITSHDTIKLSHTRGDDSKNLKEFL